MSLPLIGPTYLRLLLGQEGLVILDCRFSLMDKGAGSLAYLRGHIPGAFDPDLEEELSSAVTTRSGRHPLPSTGEFEAWLQKWGVTDESTLVAYDDRNEGFATRAWWLARWAGLPRVYVLDGGYNHWVKAGGPVATDYPNARSTTFRIRRARMRGFPPIS